MRSGGIGPLMFRVQESEVVDPERVERGLALWADFLAAHGLQAGAVAPGSDLNTGSAES